MSYRFALRASRLFVLASSVAALALSSAFAGDISASLPESGTKSSNGPDFKITNGMPGSASVRPTAISGIATGTDGRGVLGEAEGARGIGVLGVNSSTGEAGRFVLSGTATGSGDTALMALHSGGSTTTGNYYGSAAI